MRKALVLLLFVFGVVSANGSSARAAQETGPNAEQGVSGKWIANADFLGTTIYLRMELKDEGGKLTGNFDGDKLEGTLAGNSIHFVAKAEDGGTAECTATLKNGVMSGTIIFTDPDNVAHPETHIFTANRRSERRSGTAQRHEFIPTKFYRRFSAANEPVLRISPGDTVHTTTVDAGGTDEKGVRLVLGGNPENRAFLC